MNKTFIKDMRLLLKTAYDYLKDGTSNGCYHLALEDGLYLVAGYDSDEKAVLAKVAYNCSSLQCDYDIDWSMPFFRDNDCCFVEVMLDGHTFRKTAEYMYAEAKAMIRMKNKGLVYDWNNLESEED